MRAGPQGPIIRCMERGLTYQRLSFYLQEMHLPCGHKWLKVKVFKMTYHEESNKRQCCCTDQTKETKRNWMVRVERVTI